MDFEVLENYEVITKTCCFFLFQFPKHISSIWIIQVSELINMKDPNWCWEHTSFSRRRIIVV